jgi:hypothetical protein
VIQLDEFTREFPIVTRTDRDAEMPLLQDWLRDKQFVDVLDVGAFWSGNYYARDLQDACRTRYGYFGIDILEPDEATLQFIPPENYIVGNAVTHQFGRTYEAVTCVSVIEHAGVSTYKVDPKAVVAEQNALFARCLSLAEEYLFLSFPIGQAYVSPGQLSVITGKQVSGWWKALADAGWRHRSRFAYSQGPQAGFPWREHTSPALAASIPYLEFVGNQSLCIIEAERKS